MMDLINTTLLPFLLMVILSIALIVCLYRSRSRINLSTSRDNRIAISTISLNIMFFVFNFPMTFYDYITYYESFLSYFLYLLDLCYFGLGFYMQLIVNRDFREEFLRLFNLKLIRKIDSSHNLEINSIVL